MSTKQTLTNARSMLVRGWTRGVYARDADGNEVSTSDTEAVCWCLEGAIFESRTSYDNYADMMEAIACCIDGERICNFNDRQESVEPVLALIDKAIEQASS